MNWRDVAELRRHRIRIIKMFRLGLGAAQFFEKRSEFMLQHIR